MQNNIGSVAFRSQEKCDILTSKKISYVVNGLSEDEVEIKIADM